VIEEIVVRRVDEKLRPTAVFLPRVGHAQSADVVGGFIDEFIRYASLARVSRHELPGDQIRERGRRRGTARARDRRSRVARVRTSELLKSRMNEIE
jgi:hypothetical protein